MSDRFDYKQHDTELSDVEKICRARFGHGHPNYVKITLEELELHNRKNEEYASGGDALGNFKRVAVIKSLYPNFPWDKPVGVALSFALKSFDAVLWGLATKRDLAIDSYDERLADVGVYVKLMRLLLKEESKKS
jgi:hypothetical protein